MSRVLFMFALLILSGCTVGLSHENTWEPEGNYEGSRWLYKERHTERRRN